jgi:cell cycle sensor histidine kinase DivJ
LAETLDIAPHPATAGDRTAVLIWHGAWLASVILIMGGLLIAFGVVSWPITGALIAVALPPALALALRERDSRQARSLLLVVWAVAGGVACGLAGGVSGPLAVLCLAPVAAATLLGSSRLGAEAAALAVMAGVMTALAQAAHLWPAAPGEPVRFWLGLSSLSLLGLTLAGGLTVSRRRGEAQRAADGATREGLERLLTEQPHLLAALNDEGRVLSAFGYSPEGLAEAVLLQQGLVHAAELADRQAVVAALRAAFSTGAADCQFRPLGAPRRWIGLSLLKSDDTRLIAALQDVTAQHEREAALVTAKVEAEAANSGKSRFLANMSHELRTPLNTIMGFSDMMRVKLFGPLPPKYAEYAELIHESGRHLLDLINDVLDISKIEAERFQLQIEPLDARDPVSAALRLMRVQADDAGVGLRAILPPTALAIQADNRALKQIVLNLVSNALKFTPRGGEVTVTLGAQGEDLELVVADTGVGIAQEDLKRLGQPFQQAGDAIQRAKGAGLGLSLVRAFAELHGGQMIIESALGEGTCVIVRIPGVTVEPLPEPEAETRPSAKVIAFNPQR